MTVSDKLRDYVTENFLFGNTDYNLNNNDSFIEKGIIDSTGVLELVTYVEENFNLRIADEEIVPDNLDSIAKLTTFIKKKANRVVNVS